MVYLVEEGVVMVYLVEEVCRNCVRTSWKRCLVIVYLVGQLCRNCVPNGRDVL